MFFLFFLFTSFLITVISLTILGRYAVKIGILDHPGARKVHSIPTPLIGGIAIYISLLYCWIILQYLPDGSTLATIPMLVAISFVIAEGAWDDWHNTHARHRFLYHIAVAMIMVGWAGIGLHDLGKMFSDHVVVTGFLMAPLTVFAVAGGMNAYNMVDGIDGLAGSLALVSLGGMIGLAASAGLTSEVYFLGALAGAIAGFLVFNLRGPWRKQASVFLGDSGSLVIGLMMAWSLTYLTQGENRAMQPVMALWFFAVPLYDAVGMIIRRLLSNRSPLDADQEHVHHMLLKMGYSVQQVVGILAGIGAVFVMTAIAAEKIGIPQYYMFYVFIVIFVFYLYGTQRFWRTARNRETYECQKITPRSTSI